MKVLFSFTLLFISFTAFAQYDSSKILQVQNSYGYEWKNGRYTGSLIIPKDTVKLAQKDSNAIVAKGAGLYKWNGYKWVTITGAGGTTSTLQQVTNIDSVTTRKVTVGKFRITDLPEFENNESALAAGLQNGDQYRLPYNDGAYRVATAKVEPPITMSLSVSAGNNVYFLINSSRPAQSLDWGDGQVQLNISGFNHTYANAGRYIVKVIYNNYSNITTINFFTNTVLSSYSQPYLPSLSLLNLSGQTLLTAEVNAILIQLNNYGYAGGLNLYSQSPPAPPTGNGIIAKNAINARGGTVTTD